MTMTETHREQQREIAQAIRRVHLAIRDTCLENCRQMSMEQLAQVARQEKEDACFNIDLEVEKRLPELLERELGPVASVAVVFEGQGDEPPLVVPHGVPEQRAEFRAIIDPVDGSRGIAYQVRPAWVLTAVAPNRGAQTSIADAEVVVQTEIPIVNQRESACLSVIRGEPLVAEMHNIDSGVVRPLTLNPTSAETIENGYVGVETYFDGPSVLLSEIQERLIAKVLGPGEPGAARVWHDTYISSAGVVYGLLCGKLRWAHDFRPLVRQAMDKRGLAMSLTAHPYDLCTAPLLAASLDVHITDPWGAPLDVPMILDHDVAWIGYANGAIRRQVEPHLQTVLREFMD